ncbi:MAG: hypothetical protein MUC73_14050 [Cyclobacteriaceae bacterium]|jgi:hypothetical protein|nr:hypothetical protein [Cyclobacteriaceae bacterium]
MKTTLALSTLAIALSSFTNYNSSKMSDRSIDHFGRATLTALQHASLSEYQVLFPALDEFYLIMEKQSGVYGSTLEDAKADFANTYQEKLMPELHESFKRVMKEGKDIGIDWKTVQFLRVENDEVESVDFNHATLRVVFSAQGVEHALVFRKALVINNQWKITPFADLI